MKTKSTPPYLVAVAASIVVFVAPANAGRSLRVPQYEAEDPDPVASRPARTPKEPTQAPVPPRPAKEERPTTPSSGDTGAADAASAPARPPASPHVPVKVPKTYEGNYGGNAGSGWSKAPPRRPEPWTGPGRPNYDWTRPKASEWSRPRASDWTRPKASEWTRPRASEWIPPDTSYATNSYASIFSGGDLGYYELGFGPREAVNQCVFAAKWRASRLGVARVTAVTSIERIRHGFIVHGRLVVRADSVFSGSGAGFRGGAQPAAQAIEDIPEFDGSMADIVEYDGSEPRLHWVDMGDVPSLRLGDGAGAAVPQRSGATVVASSGYGGGFVQRLDKGRFACVSRFGAVTNVRFAKIAGLH